MGLKKCFHCSEVITTEQEKFMLALEKPYTNLWFHRACYVSVKGDIEAYLLQNVEKVYNYHEGLGKNTQK